MGGTSHEDVPSLYYSSREAGEFQRVESVTGTLGVVNNTTNHTTITSYVKMVYFHGTHNSIQPDPYECNLLHCSLAS
jgi:hypothetical protein